jgi:hypothetical protein
MSPASAARAGEGGVMACEPGRVIGTELALLLRTLCVTAEGRKAPPAPPSAARRALRPIGSSLRAGMQKSLLLVSTVAALTSAASAQDRLFVLRTPHPGAEVVELDPATATPIGSSPVSGHEALFGGLALDAAGDLYSIDGYNDANSDRTFRIDATTGAGVVVGDTGFNWNFRSVAVNPVDDMLYGWTDNSLYRLNKSTGAATLVANVSAPPNLDQGTALAISSAGVGYLTDIGDNSLFSLNLTTGAATFLGHLNPGAMFVWFGDLDFDGAGNLWGVHESGGIYRITLSPPVATLVFPTITYTGIAFERGALGTTYCSPAVVNSTGVPAEIGAQGSLVVTANMLTVEAEHLPLSSFGYFLTSRTQGFTANPGGSMGHLCLGGSIGRFVGPGQIQNSGTTGAIALGVNLMGLPTPTGPVAGVAGETWSFQAWYRDAVGGNPTSNFTNGVALTLQ